MRRSDQVEVLLLAGTPPLLDYQKSVLGQPAFSLEWTESDNVAFSSLCRRNFKLAVIEQCRRFALPYFLERVRNGIKTQLPPFLVVVGASVRPPSLPFPVHLHDALSGMEDFDRRVTELSGYRDRRARRHLVRVNFRDQATGALLGSSHNISAFGMLLELNKRVAIGAKIKTEFLGVSSLQGFALTGKVLREESHSPSPPSGGFYAVEFIHDPAEGTLERLGGYLKDFEQEV